MPPGRPKGSAKRTFDDARVDARNAADEILSKPPKALREWAERQGVDLPTPVAGDQPVIWMHVDRRLRQHGLLDVARIWRLEQTREVQAAIGGSKLLAKEIIYRVIIPRIYSSRSLVAVAGESDDRSLANLPPDIKWVYQHPLLMASGSAKGKIDPVVQAMGTHYEQENPAPTHGARSMLARCVADPKQADRLMTKVQDFLLDTSREEKHMQDGEPAKDGEGSVGEKAEIEALFDDELAALGDDDGEDE